MPEVKVKIVGENKDALDKLDQVEEKGQGLGGSIGGALKTGLGNAARVGAAAMAATAAAVGAVGKAALDAYANFEQLSGGTELMFGDAAETVMARAANAFDRVQLSANEYLERANYYAVGLTEALDGNSQAAADLADGIITAQADIVAATGMSADSVSNAFEGVMRGNYTMLDNLGLGIKGTKEGLQEVIDKVNEVNGTEYSIDNVADAQQAIIDYVEYVGMAGYAQEEAMGTIQGSLAATRAAWDNLLAGLANPDVDPASIMDLVDNLMVSVSAVASNVTPIIQAIASSIGTALPIIMPQAIQLASGLMGTLLETVVALTPMLLESFQQVLQMLVDALPTMLPMLLEAGLTLFLGIVTALAEAAPQIIDALSTTLITLIGMLPELVPALLEAAFVFFGAIVEGIITKGPEILAALGTALSQLLQKVVENGPEMLAKFGELMGKAKEGISQKADQIWTALKQAVKDALDKVTSIDLGKVGSDIIEGIKNGLTGAAGKLASAAREAASSALSAAKDFLGIKSPSRVFRDQVGKMIVMGAVEGIEDASELYDAAIRRTFSVDLQPWRSAGNVTNYGGATYNTYLDYNAGENAFQLALDTSRAIKLVQMARG